MDDSDSDEGEVARQTLHCSPLVRSIWWVKRMRKSIDEVIQKQPVMSNLPGLKNYVSCPKEPKVINTSNNLLIWFHSSTSNPIKGRVEEAKIRFPSMFP